MSTRPSASDNSFVPNRSGNNDHPVGRYKFDRSGMSTLRLRSGVLASVQAYLPRTPTLNTPCESH